LGGRETSVPQASLNESRGELARYALILDIVAAVAVENHIQSHVQPGCVMPINAAASGLARKAGRFLSSSRG
jgi:hypothetical protein